LATEEKESTEATEGFFDKSKNPKRLKEI